MRGAEGAVPYADVKAGLEKLGLGTGPSVNSSAETSG